MLLKLWQSPSVISAFIFIISSAKEVGYDACCLIDTEKTGKVTKGALYPARYGAFLFYAGGRYDRFDEPRRLR